MYPPGLYELSRTWGSFDSKNLMGRLNIMDWNLSFPKQYLLGRGEIQGPKTGLGKEKFFLSMHKAIKIQSHKLIKLQSHKDIKLQSHKITKSINHLITKP
jgi:hypothetical protein